MPGGRGLFKPIDLDSYAKVIKQLLVCAVLGTEQRVTASPSVLFSSLQLCVLKRKKKGPVRGLRFISVDTSYYNSTKVST